MAQIRRLTKRAQATFLVGAYYAIAGAAALILGSVAHAKGWPSVFTSVCLGLAGLCILAVAVYLAWGIAAVRTAETLAWGLDQRDIIAAAAKKTRRDPRGRRVLTLMHRKPPAVRWEPWDD